ncbi:MAG TPA: AAA family ATPase, partial [Gammaproteobacteria bacterium]|nr:AAA family ATPase [Gammaproteobacteria bacterium]
MSMRSLFKSIITEFHQGNWPKPIPRNLDLPTLPAHVRKAIIFIGMRRSGKSWTMYQIMQMLLQQGINKTQCLYINFSDERLLNMQAQDFQDILDAYYELYPEYVDYPAGQLHFFFDEIQEIAGWEKFIRRLLDTESAKLYISGSSAKMLSSEIATVLRGRTLVREIFPFDFRVYLRAYATEVEVNHHLTSKKKSVLRHHL